MLNKIGKFIVGLGPLRVMLATAAIVMIVLRPAPGTEAVFEGWAVFPTLLFPSLSPIIFMVLMLDVLMSSVYLSAHKGAKRQRLQRARLTNLAVAAAVLIFWFPYFYKLLQG